MIWESRRRAYLMGPTARPLWFGTSQLAAVKVEMASRRHPVSTNDFNDVNVDDCKFQCTWWKPNLMKQYETKVTMLEIGSAKPSDFGSLAFIDAKHLCRATLPWKKVSPCSIIGWGFLMISSWFIIDPILMFRSLIAVLERTGTMKILFLQQSWQPVEENSNTKMRKFTGI